MHTTQSSNTLIINISLDHVAVYSSDSHSVIPYKNLERTLPKKLKEIFLLHTPQACIVLNWPGGFTALRIWSLSIQMLCDHFGIDCYSVSKIAFYRHYYEQGLIPRFYRAYIWQKNNFWLYDFDNADHAKIHLSQVEHYLQKIAELDESYAFDAIDTHAFIQDAVRKDAITQDAAEKRPSQKRPSQEPAPQKLCPSNALIRKIWSDSNVWSDNNPWTQSNTWANSPEGLTLQYHDQSTPIDPAVFLDKQYKVDVLRPNYMIDPTLS